MPEAAIAAVAVVITASVTFLVSRPKSVAETTQIVDEIARQWIEELRDEITRLRVELDRVRRERAAEVYTYVHHIGVLESHINDRKPPPPPDRPPFDKF